MKKYKHKAYGYCYLCGFGTCKHLQKPFKGTDKQLQEAIKALDKPIKKGAL